MKEMSKKKLDKLKERLLESLEKKREDYNNMDKFTNEEMVFLRETFPDSFKNYKDIIVTLPKKVKWEDYERELETVKDGKEVMNFKVNHLPKTNVGCRCYLVHDGFIKGWMEIVGLSNDGFTCTTTGQKWDGKFIQRSGEFHYIEPIPMKGFQGFRYIK